MNEENGPLSQEEIDALLQALQTETPSDSVQQDDSPELSKASDSTEENSAAEVRLTPPVPAQGR
ncbi:MAG: hypothetical protein OWS74_01995, partial [Firmicutes bacterium]|nr:hypothetical protein [Bacillota bacterium]